MLPVETKRRVRICRPAFQDMHHLVAPRLVARAQLRRQMFKLQWWEPTDKALADVTCRRISGEAFYALQIDDGYGVADGFRVVFCEVKRPEPEGTICVLAVLRSDELLTEATRSILRARERIAHERVCVVHDDFFAR